MLTCIFVVQLANANRCEALFSQNETEILSLDDLKNSDVIPQGIYVENSVNEIAKALVQRIRKAEQKINESDFKGNPKAVDFLNETDLILFFWSKNSTSIESNGFQNQHQTGKSGMTFDPNTRASAEDNYSGVKLGYSNEAKRLRPKSTFLNLRSKINLAHKVSEIFSIYGDVGAVLKKDLKERSIWMSGDSLQIGTGTSMEVSGDFSPRSLLSYAGTFSRTRIPSQSADLGYYEAVVYGDIRVSDVDYFLVSDYYLASNQELLPRLKALGIPIYKATYSLQNNRVIFGKGTLIYDGTN